MPLNSLNDYALVPGGGTETPTADSFSWIDHTGQRLYAYRLENSELTPLGG
jgi:hypothetical protein